MYTLKNKSALNTDPKTPTTTEEWNKLYKSAGKTILENPLVGVPIAKHIDDVVAHRQEVSRMGRRFFDTSYPDHDQSKFSVNEMVPYAVQHFTPAKDTDMWFVAREHHWAHNPHHPEFWKDDVDEAPECFRQEAFCDIVACVYGRKHQATYMDIEATLRKLLGEWTNPAEKNNERFQSWIKNFVRYGNHALKSLETPPDIQTSWTCKACYMVMKTGKSYANHLANSHPKDPCAYCETVGSHEPECSTRLVYRCNECADSSLNPTALLNKAKQDHGPGASIKAVPINTDAQSLPGGTGANELLNSAIAAPNVSMGTVQTAPKVSQALVGTIDTVADQAKRWAEVARFTVTDTDIADTRIFEQRWSDPDSWSPAALYLRNAHKYLHGKIHYRVVFFGATNKTGSMLIGTLPEAVANETATSALLRSYGQWTSHTFNGQLYTDYFLAPQTDSVRAIAKDVDTGPRLVAFVEEPVANTLGTGATQITMQLMMRLDDDYMFTVPEPVLPNLLTTGTATTVAIKDILLHKEGSNDVADSVTIRVNLDGTKYFDRRPLSTREIPPPLTITDRPLTNGGSAKDDEQRVTVLLRLGDSGTVPFGDGSVSDTDVAHVFFYGTGDEDTQAELDVAAGTLTDNKDYYYRFRDIVPGATGSHMLTTISPKGTTYFVYVVPDFFTPDTNASTATCAEQWKDFFASITYSLDGVPSSGNLVPSALPGDARRIAFGSPNMPLDTIATSLYDSMTTSKQSPINDKIVAYFKGRFPAQSVSFSLIDGNATFPLKWDHLSEEVTFNTQTLWFASAFIRVNRAVFTSFAPVRQLASGPKGSARQWHNIVTYGTTQAQATLGMAELTMLMGLGTASNLVETSVHGGFQLAGQKRHQNFVAQQAALQREMAKEMFGDGLAFKRDMALAKNQAFQGGAVPGAAGGNVGKAAFAPPPPDHAPPPDKIGLENSGYRMLAKGIGGRTQPSKARNPITMANPQANLIEDLSAQHKNWKDPEIQARDPFAAPQFAAGGTEGGSDLPSEKRARFFRESDTGHLSAAANMGRQDTPAYDTLSLYAPGETNINDFDAYSTFEWNEGPSSNLPSASRPELMLPDDSQTDVSSGPSLPSAELPRETIDLTGTPKNDSNLSTIPEGSVKSSSSA